MRQGLFVHLAEKIIEQLEKVHEIEASEWNGTCFVVLNSKTSTRDVFISRRLCLP